MTFLPVPRFNDVDQWVQVDFGMPERISGILTQGHPGNLQWVESYFVMTSLDGVSWYWYADQDTKKAFTVFPANINGNTPVYAYFDREIDAQYVRIVPKTWHNGIALRFEVLSCYGQPTSPPPGHFTSAIPTLTPPQQVTGQPTVMPTPSPRT